MKKETGTVLRSTGGLSIVKHDKTGELIECTLRGRIRLKGARSTNPVVVGDKVVLHTDTTHNQTVITEILKRKNYIIRRATNHSKESHILAANIDNFYIIATLAEPNTSLMFIDRMLITAEAYRIDAKIVFNKIDLYEDEELLERFAEYITTYESIGYQCFRTSASKNIGIDDIKNDMAGKVSLFAGHSGTGKSSLINRIDPSLNLKIGDISEAHKQGKHTTTFATMHETVNNSYIIDTPGIRSFGLIDIDRDELYHFFPEIFKSSEHCQFYNCTHIHEPGCNVIQDVEEGIIPESRYFNYVTIFLDDDDEKYRHDDYA